MKNKHRKDAFYFYVCYSYYRGVIMVVKVSKEEKELKKQSMEELYEYS